MEAGQLAEITVRTENRLTLAELLPSHGQPGSNPQVLINDLIGN
jgi:hypothetical protein